MNATKNILAKCQRVIKILVLCNLCTLNSTPSSHTLSSPCCIRHDKMFETIITFWTFLSKQSFEEFKVWRVADVK